MNFSCDYPLLKYTYHRQPLHTRAGDLYKRLDVNLQGIVPVVTPGDEAIVAMQMADLHCWAQVSSGKHDQLTACKMTCHLVA